MWDRLWRYLKFALVAAAGALSLAAVAEILVRQFPSPAPRLVCTPTVLVLALDKSGSMIEGRDKLQLVKEAVARFVARASTDPCIDEKRFGLVSFNRDADLDILPTDDLDQFAVALDRLVPEGGTEIEKGVDVAVDVLRSEAFREWTRVVFLLTDAENFSTGPDPLQRSLEMALGEGVEVRAVVTEEGPQFAVLTEVLGTARVTRVEDAALGETFFEQAEQVALSPPILLPERPLSALARYLASGLWTGLVTAGITLALLIFLNRYNKRNRTLSGREILTVVIALLLGFVVGAATEYLFSFEAVAQALTGEGGFMRAHLEDLLVWSVIGLLLALGLAGFRILPNLKILHTVGFGLLGGLVAGLVFAAAAELWGAGFVSRLLGATALGLSFGFVLGLLTDTGIQFPVWLRVYYTSDRVYRYHPLGSDPVTVGSGRDADVYLQGDHEKMWQFWIEDGRVKIHNFIADKVRSLPFTELAHRGAIELKGMTLKIVDDRGPEKGRMR